MTRTCRVALVALALAAGVQDGRAAGFDARAFIAGLQNSATRDRELGQFANLPQEAIAPLMEAAAATDTPESARADLKEHLPALYAHWRAERVKADQALDDAWTRRELVDVYKRGPGGATTLAPAEAALRYITTGKENYTVFKAAVDAQSAAGVSPDDPVIHVAYVISGLSTREMAVDKAVRQLDRALAELDKSNYSDGVKFVLHLWVLDCLTSTAWPGDFAVKANFKDESARMLELLPAFVATHPGQKHLAREMTVGFAALSLGLKDPAAFERMSPVLDKVLTGNVIHEAIRAAAYEQWAWEGRGGGFADTVTSQGWQDFADRLPTARTAAEAGWREDPLNSSCCDTMLSLCIAMQLGDDALQMWFERALLANPNDYEAYSVKAFYYSPQWHGDLADAIGFGQQCIQAGTARNRISLVMLEVYENAAAFVPEPSTFYRQPGIWNDIQAAYAVVLADPTRMKDDRRQLLNDRAMLMQYAVLCGQWQAFLDLSKKYGNDIDVTTLGGKDRLAFFQREAAEKLKSAAPG